MQNTPRKVTPTQIALFVPNLIGYVRYAILLLMLFTFSKPWITMIGYFTSFALDGLDGIAARRLNQSILWFGAFLDMITDRVGTTTFILLLSHAQVPESTWLILWVMMDLTSHWSRTTRYKVLDFYYNVKFGMTPFCVGAELYIIAVYCRAFTKHEFIAAPFYWIFFLLFWGKFVIHGFQLVNSCQDILEVDAHEKSLVQ